jgi:hypothetical protein
LKKIYLKKNIYLWYEDMAYIIKRQKANMPNYQLGKVYIIRSPSRPDLVYIGSTTQPLSKRFHSHKRDRDCTSVQVIDIGDAYIELLELVQCDSKIELQRREGEIIRATDCVNKRIEGRTREEYLVENKEHRGLINKTWRSENAESIKIKEKKYKADNKEKYKRYNKEYGIQHRINEKKIRICVCGSSYNEGKSSTRKDHYQSQRHTDYINSFYSRLHAKLTS